MSEKGQVTVRQIRSGIGFEESQKRTLRALGLGKMGRERTLADNEAVPRHACQDPAPGRDHRERRGLRPEDRR